jgi:hypothetical protein
MGSDCVFRWRKSSFSSSGGDCVELSWTGAVRDSKNPDGPVIRVNLRALMRAIRSGRLN